MYLVDVTVVFRMMVAQGDSLDAQQAATNHVKQVIDAGRSTERSFVVLVTDQDIHTTKMVVLEKTKAITPRAF